MGIEHVFGFDRLRRGVHVDACLLLLGATVEKMARVTPEEIYLALMNGTTAGPPCTWAWDGDSFIMYPRRNQAYQLTVGGFLAGGTAYSSEIKVVMPLDLRAAPARRFEQPKTEQI